MKDKLTLITGDAKPDPAAELLREAEANMAQYKAFAEFDAKRRKVVYDALIKAGFTPEQALQLTK